MENANTSSGPGRNNDVHAPKAKHYEAPRAMLFLHRHPMVTVCTAGALGYVLARLYDSGRRSLKLADRDDRRERFNGASLTTTWPIAKSPRPHGDKLASAARVAATRTFAPTYPEG